MTYKPLYKQAPTLMFEDNIQEFGYTVTDMKEHDEKLKQMAQNKIMKQ